MPFTSTVISHGHHVRWEGNSVYMINVDDSLGINTVRRQTKNTWMPTLFTTRRHSILAWGRVVPPRSWEEGKKRKEKKKKRYICSGHRNLQTLSLHCCDRFYSALSARSNHTNSMECKWWCKQNQCGYSNRGSVNQQAPSWSQGKESTPSTNCKVKSKKEEDVNALSQIFFISGLLWRRLSSFLYL